MVNVEDIERHLPTRKLMPGPDEAAGFFNVSVTPALGPAYVFSSVLPVGWHKIDDPPNPSLTPSADKFAALGVFSPTRTVVPPAVVSFGVILAPNQGSVRAWFEAYCRGEGYSILSVRPQRFLAGRVIDGLLSREAPGVGAMLIRLAMFEDGGRLFVLAGMAPEAIYEKLVREISLAMVSFELLWPRGATVPLE